MEKKSLNKETDLVLFVAEYKYLMLVMAKDRLNMPSGSQYENTSESDGV